MSNKDTMKRILEKIREYDKIVISRHIRPDGDAVGSTQGFKAMLKLTYPEKDIRLINEDYSEYMSFLGPEDSADDAFYDGALVIVLDTGTMDRISNKKANLGKEIIKIDHHIDDKPYGDISWVEDYRSSCCEMIAAFYMEFSNELKINKEVATFIYAGMITDSGRFKYKETSGETLRCAAAMLEQGIDTETLYAHLDLEEMEHFKFEAYVYNKMKMSESGVLYIFITKAIQEKFGLSQEQASTSVGYMDGVKGSLIWLAFIDNGDGSTRVRLRSRFVPVQELATHYHGGGHLYASGATVYSKKEAMSLLNDADRLLKEYKENNEGWI